MSDNSITDQEWHDIEYHHLPSWVKKKQKILHKHELVGRRFLYRLIIDGAGYHYQRRLRHRVSTNQATDTKINQLKGQMERWRGEGYEVLELERLFIDPQEVGGKAQKGEELSSTRADLDRVLEANNYTPLKLIEFLEREFKVEYSGDLGLWEKYSLKQHTLMVLGQFEKYFSYRNLPAHVDTNFFRLILAMHDMGKPLAVKRNEKHLARQLTIKLMSPILSKLGYSAHDITLASALVFGDPIGQYLRVKDVKIADIKKSAQMIGIMAEEVDLPIMDFFNLLLIYYMVDASSYTEDAGGKKSLDKKFVFDSVARKIEFAPPEAQKIDDLRTFLYGKSGKF